MVGLFTRCMKMGIKKKSDNLEVLIIFVPLYYGLWEDVNIGSHMKIMVVVEKSKVMMNMWY